MLGRLTEKQNEPAKSLVSAQLYNFAVQYLNTKCKYICIIKLVGSRMHNLLRLNIFAAYVSIVTILDPCCKNAHQFLGEF